MRYSKEKGQENSGRTPYKIMLMAGDQVKEEESSEVPVRLEEE